MFEDCYSTEERADEVADKACNVVGEEWQVEDASLERQGDDAEDEEQAGGH